MFAQNFYLERYIPTIIKQKLRAPLRIHTIFPCVRSQNFLFYLSYPVSAFPHILNVEVLSSASLKSFPKLSFLHRIDNEGKKWRKKKTQKTTHNKTSAFHCKYSIPQPHLSFFWSVVQTLTEMAYLVIVMIRQSLA